MLPKKLTCEEALEIINNFLEGVPMTELAEDFEVSRIAVRNILYRKTYKKCKNVLEAHPIDSNYFSLIEMQSHENRRKSRGRGNTGRKE